MGSGASTENQGTADLRGEVGVEEVDGVLENLHLFGREHIEFYCKEYSGKPGVFLNSESSSM